MYIYIHSLKITQIHKMKLLSAIKNKNLANVLILAHVL